MELHTWARCYSHVGDEGDVEHETEMGSNRLKGDLYRKASDMSMFGTVLPLNVYDDAPQVFEESHHMNTKIQIQKQHGPLNARTKTTIWMKTLILGGSYYLGAGEIVSNSKNTIPTFN